MILLKIIKTSIYEKDGVEYLTDEAFNKFVRGGELYSLRKNGT